MCARIVFLWFSATIYVVSYTHIFTYPLRIFYAPGFLLFKTLTYKYIVIAATGTWTKSNIVNASPLIFNPPQFLIVVSYFSYLRNISSRTVSQDIATKIYV